MSKLVVMPENDWKGILDSVRSKTGKTNLMISKYVASEINSIQTGVPINNQDITIKENGTYTADEGYTGLGEVIVEVPPTPPNNQDISVTKNGTYIADEGYTGLGIVTVNVSTGDESVTVSPKDVNFYDYDGTLLYSYTVEEAQALTSLPILPIQEGLICQGWNYDLETIKAHNRALNIGATYITDDGKTRLYIKIAAEGRMTVPLYFSQTVANSVVIDWGDGSATETVDGTGNVNTTHTYASIGDYVISLDVADGCTLSLGGTSSYCVMGSNSKGGEVYCSMLQKVEIGRDVILKSYAFDSCTSLALISMPNSITFSGYYIFQSCYSLTSVIIPNCITKIEPYTFEYCYSLVFVSIPNSVLNFSSNSFNRCQALASISMPDSVSKLEDSVFTACYALAPVSLSNGMTKIGASTFSNCYSLASISIPNSVASIGNYAFQDCTGVAFYDFTSHTTVPTIQSTTFKSIPSDCQIRVPASLYDKWKSATNWSSLAKYIVAV